MHEPLEGWKDNLQHSPFQYVLTDEFETAIAVAISGCQSPHMLNAVDMECALCLAERERGICSEMMGVLHQTWKLRVLKYSSFGLQTCNQGLFCTSVV